MSAVDVKANALDYLIRRASDEDAATEWGVLCHGFGSNARDLLPLCDALDPESRRTWLFPEAPVVLGTGVGGPNRAWFPRNEAGLADVITGEYFDRLPQVTPSGLAESATEILALLQSLGVRLERTIFGGFSQGSMVALQAGLESPVPPRGLLLFSAALVAEGETRRLAESASPIVFVQSHGTADPILSYDHGQALHRVLIEAGHRGELVTFPGGHEIPRVAIEAARRL